MPNNFALHKKNTPPEEPSLADLVRVDEEICAHLGVEVHPDKYVAKWFDWIGFAIACGKPLGSDELRTEIALYVREGCDPRLPEILAYLEQHYTSEAWASLR